MNCRSALRHPQFLSILVFCCLFSNASYAAPPEEYEIPGIRVDSIRLTSNENEKYDYDTDKVFHPYLTECINTILGFYNNPYRLTKIYQGLQEPTADRYLDSLVARGIKIGKMDKLQGRVLRVLISNNIPVLLIGKYHNTQRKVYRIHADVIYMYREPDFTQSSKILPGDQKYAFKTARGWTLISEEIREPARLHNTGVAGSSSYVGNPLSAFEYFCVLVTPEIPIKKIKRIINDGLGDVGFEYKLPEFSMVKAVHVTW